MKKAILIFLAVLLLIPIQLSSQEKEFRIITKKLDTFYGKQYYNGKRVIVIDSTGKSMSLRPQKILSIREEIKGWKYFEWGTNEFTDYLKISIDSMNRDELFISAKQWIKEYFISTKHGFLIQPDSIFAEHEGRKSSRNSYWPKGYINKADGLPRIIPELKTKFYIDEKNYKITLVACNQLILYGISFAATSPIVFYTINLTFHEGEYKIDPVDLFFCYSYKDTLFGQDPDFFDHLLNDVNKVYYFGVPLSDTAYLNNKSGIVHSESRCFISRIEVLLNELNRTLYNYIQGNRDSPNPYVCYPETNCWSYWRR